MQPRISKDAGDLYLSREAPSTRQTIGFHRLTMCHRQDCCHGHLQLVASEFSR